MASRIKVGRPPGPDGIPPEAIKWMTEKRPREVAKVSGRNISSTIKEGTRKIAGYRPLCMLDTMGKLYEQRS